MNIYEQAVAKFGADHQILKAVSELNELATALMHYREGKATKEDVWGEMVDVLIMQSQLPLIIGQVPDEIYAEKLNKFNIAINK